MTERKNTASAVGGNTATRSRKPRKTAAQKRAEGAEKNVKLAAEAEAKTTALGAGLVDVTGTDLVKDKLAGVVAVAEESPQTDFGAKQVVAEKPAEKPAEAPKAESKPTPSKGAATPAKPAKKAAAKKTAAKVVKPKVEVTDADLAKLVYVPDSQGDKVKTRHLDSCPAYFDKRWNNATTFTKVTDAKRLAELKPCRSCATRAAALRVGAAK